MAVTDMNISQWQNADIEVGLLVEIARPSPTEPHRAVTPDGKGRAP
jgi:hypothetical protein